MRTSINAIQIKSMLAYLRKHTPASRFRPLCLVFKPLFVFQLFLDIALAFPGHALGRLAGTGRGRADSYDKKTAFVRSHLADFIFRF